LEIIRASEVLYVPRLRLQVLPNDVVPSEAVHARSLEFERARDFLGGAERFRRPFETRRFDGDVCILSNLYSRNFGHWITEELLKVTVLEWTGFTGQYVLYDQPAFSHELLRCLGVPDERILIIDDEPAVFSAAVFMTPLNVVTALQYPGVFLALRRSLLRAATPSDRSPTPRKIWLQRNAQVNNGRPLLNADEVYEIVARHGFDVVDMGDLPVRRQIALANGAEVIAGPHGAGLVHAMFMESGSTVVECFSPEFINAGNFCPEICSLLEHRWFMLVHSNARGAYPYGDNLKIDPFQLELLIRSIAAK
jgi:capsular polysaccharide biosynthesis protein